MRAWEVLYGLPMVFWPLPVIPVRVKISPEIDCPLPFLNSSSLSLDSSPVSGKIPWELTGNALKLGISAVSYETGSEDASLSKECGASPCVKRVILGRVGKSCIPKQQWEYC